MDYLGPWFTSNCMQNISSLCSSLVRKLTKRVCVSAHYDLGNSRARVSRYLFVLALCLPNSTTVFSQEWSEKDLAKSVIRAEATFEDGEMSRAYGLFAHLVSVAGDRPFLHYRFGATCTYTSSRLSEAKIHLEWARDLGILETEHASGWYYYLAKLNHLEYAFDEAQLHYEMALNASGGKEDWRNDAQLAYEQCLNQSALGSPVKEVDVLESMESHSDDFFRLYQMPIESGRLLVVPENLIGKEDKARGYEPVMHWLSDSRFAFYSSYGKNGDTGLDVYRVTVNGNGISGIPERLDEPINSPYDDCAPICVPSNDPSQKPDRIYFSSSRPESMGGFDVFSVEGQFTKDGLHVVHQESFAQLPFEINSSSDEWLFWPDERSGTAWVTTNRNNDFEGREVWRVAISEDAADPISMQIQWAEETNLGLLEIFASGIEMPVLKTRLEVSKPLNLVVGESTTMRLVWSGDDGVVSELSVDLPAVNGPQLATEPLVLSMNSKAEMQVASEAGGFVDYDQLAWTPEAMLGRQSHGAWLEQIAPEEAATIQSGLERDEAMNAGYSLKVNQVFGNDLEVPEWVLTRLQSIGVEVSNGEELQVQTVQVLRSKSVLLQNRMEAMACWDAPGSETWRAHEALSRLGEPVLASLAIEAKKLQSEIDRQFQTWQKWSLALDRSMRLNPTKTEEALALNLYVNNQLESYQGASEQASDLVRRVEAHLSFERWVSNALPMDIQEFKSDLVQLSMRDGNVANSFRQLASALSEGSESSDWVVEVQNFIWRSLADSIMDVQSLGVYDLPDMAPAQSWFLRSGALMEESKKDVANDASIMNGRRGIALAWDAFSEGANKRDVVADEARMSPGDWWKSFGSDVNSDLTEGDYSGYELFVAGNSMLLDQAKLYQEELDFIRINQPKSDDYQASMSRAIAMRSRIASEMQAMFGQDAAERVSEVKATAKSSPLSADLDSNGSDIAAPADNFSEPDALREVDESETTWRFQIQIGAFQNEPNLTELGELPVFETESLSNGLRRFCYGRFQSREEAVKALESVRQIVPDAFIQHVQTKKDQETFSQSNQAGERVEAKPNDQKNDQFRIRVASFQSQLPSSDVARLLRLGNNVKLRTIRQSGVTIYYSEPFHSLVDANSALSICKSNGFTTAEVEVLN